MTGRRDPARDMEAARAIARQAASLGGAAYYVGGFVRDRLLGQENTDVDIEVHGVTPRQLAEILAQVKADFISDSEIIAMHNMLVKG